MELFKHLLQNVPLECVQRDRGNCISPWLRRTGISVLASNLLAEPRRDAVLFDPAQVTIRALTIPPASYYHQIALNEDR